MMKVLTLNSTHCQRLAGSTVKSEVEKQRGGRQDAGLNKFYNLNQKEACHHERAYKETIKGSKLECLWSSGGSATASGPSG